MLNGYAPEYVATLRQVVAQTELELQAGGMVGIIGADADGGIEIMGDSGLAEERDGTEQTVVDTQRSMGRPIKRTDRNRR